MLERVYGTLEESNSILEQETYPNATDQFRSEVGSLEPHTAVTPQFDGDDLR